MAIQLTAGRSWIGGAGKPVGPDVDQGGSGLEGRLLDFASALTNPAALTEPIGPARGGGRGRGGRPLTEEEPKRSGPFVTKPRKSKGAKSGGYASYGGSVGHNPAGPAPNPDI